MTDPADTGPVPEEDVRLLGRLASALGADPPPEGLAGRAEGLLAFAGFDRELAGLLGEAAEPAGMRGGRDTGARLSFEVDDGSVAVEVLLAGDRLDGQVLDGAVTEVVLERADGGSSTGAVDDLGRFGFGSVPAGPARLRLRGGLPGPVTTDWFLV